MGNLLGLFGDHVEAHRVGTWLMEQQGVQTFFQLPSAPHPSSWHDTVHKARHSPHLLSKTLCPKFSPLCPSELALQLGAPGSHHQVADNSGILKTVWIEAWGAVARASLASQKSQVLSPGVQLTSCLTLEVSLRVGAGWRKTYHADYKTLYRLYALKQGFALEGP